jgi:hypothetical protein
VWQYDADDEIAVADFFLTDLLSFTFVVRRNMSFSVGLLTLSHSTPPTTHPPHHHQSLLAVFTYKKQAEAEEIVAFLSGCSFGTLLRTTSSLPRTTKTTHDTHDTHDTHLGRRAELMNALVQRMRGPLALIASGFATSSACCHRCPPRATNQMVSAADCETDGRASTSAKPAERTPSSKTKTRAYEALWSFPPTPPDVHTMSLS